MADRFPFSSFYLLIFHPTHSFSMRKDEQRNTGLRDNYLYRDLISCQLPLVLNDWSITKTRAISCMQDSFKSNNKCDL